MEAPSAAQIVTLHVRCSSNGVRSERRFDRGHTVGMIKGKLEMITGATAGLMELRLDDADGHKIGVLSDDSKMLGAYPVEDYCTLMVVDNDVTSHANEFEDLSKVEKFEITDEEYSKQRNTVRAFKERNKMGRFNPEFQAQQEEAAAAKAIEGEADAAGMKVGMRCQVREGAKRGEVMHVGKTLFAAGWWIGIKYDEPLGKNDGTVKGKSYFTCMPKYGGFVRPDKVECGDFPEEDLDFSSDGEM